MSRKKGSSEKAVWVIREAMTEPTPAPFDVIAIASSQPIAERLANDWIAARGRVWLDEWAFEDPENWGREAYKVVGPGERTAHWEIRVTAGLRNVADVEVWRLDKFTAWDESMPPAPLM